MKEGKIEIFLIFLTIALASIFAFIRFDFFQPTGFRVIFFNVGQGDSTLIQLASGERILVDCGPDKKVLSKLGEYLPFFSRKIDYLFVTHPDSDHYAGCAAVLDRYDVKNIFLNGEQKRGDYIWEAFKQARAKEKAKEKIVNGYEEISIGDSILKFFSPDESLQLSGVENTDTNNYSLVFQLISKEKTFLFTGDMEEPLEKALLGRYCPSYLNQKDLNNQDCILHSDYLKVGHHGSQSSSGEDFLRAVSAKTAVISVGPPPNKYGHPSLRVIKRLWRARLRILRTDQLDDIIIE